MDGRTLERTHARTPVSQFHHSSEKLLDLLLNIGNFVGTIGNIECSLERAINLILSRLMNILCIIVGITGNAVTFIMLSKEKKTSDIILLKCLTIVDIMVLIFTILYFVPTIGYRAHQVLSVARELHEYVVHNVLFCCLWFSVQLSMYVVVLLSIERAIVIVKPGYVAKWLTIKNTYISLAFIVVFCFILNASKLFVIKEYIYSCDWCHGEFKINAIPNTFTFKSKVYTVLYENLTVIIFYLLVPLVILVVCTVLMSYGVRKVNSSSGKPLLNNDPTSTQVTKRTLVIVVLFIILQLPASVMELLIIIGVYDRQDDMEDNYQITYILSTASSAVNFYFVCLVDPLFREKFVKTIMCQPVSHESI